MQKVHKVLKLTKMLRRKNKAGKMNRKCCGGVKSLDRVVGKGIIEKVICVRERKVRDYSRHKE